MESEVGTRRLPAPLGCARPGSVMRCCVLTLSVTGEGAGCRVLGAGSSAFWAPLCKRTADGDPSRVPGSRPGFETLPAMGLSLIVSKGGGPPSILRPVLPAFGWLGDWEGWVCRSGTGLPPTGLQTLRRDSWTRRKQAWTPTSGAVTQLTENELDATICCVSLENPPHNCTRKRKQTGAMALGKAGARWLPIGSHIC